MAEEEKKDLNEAQPKQPEESASAAASPGDADTSRIHKTEVSEGRSEESGKNVDRILDINLELVVRIGSLNMKFKDVLDLYPGSILEIDKNADGPLDLMIGTKKLAEGEVVTVGESLGLRILKRAK
jgi:flagellar motor switch protein FliN/FliY